MNNNQSFSQTARFGFNRIPVAIRTIIAVNVVVFMIQMFGRALGGQGFELFVSQWFAFNPDPIVAVLTPWRLVTYMFLHGGFFHIFFNMLILYFIGRAVEQRLGPLTFCAIYFGAGIGGALIDIGLSQFLGFAYVIGASGAVFGIMVAFAMLFPRMRVLLFFIIPIEARYLVAGLIALNVLTLGGQGNVAHAVHLGGALVGYLLMKLWQGGYDLSAPMRVFQSWWYRLKNARQKRATPSNSNMYAVSDVEVMEDVEQTELDEILEKISNHGYDALTKQEKKRLFELSNQN